jgi:excisionase family DNA binding protein
MQHPDIKFYTPEQIASLLQVNVVTVRRWLNSGKLKGYHLGRKLWRISQPQLEEFLAFEFDQGTGRANRH